MNFVKRLQAHINTEYHRLPWTVNAYVSAI